MGLLSHIDFDLHEWGCSHKAHHTVHALSSAPGTVGAEKSTVVVVVVVVTAAAAVVVVVTVVAYGAGK